MTTVSSDLLNAMNGTSGSTSNSSSLNDNSADAIQNRFLTLLIAQMKNQDPNNPMDNSQLTSQMAQLSTVSGISQLNGTLSTLLGNLSSSQTLQTANLIGHSILAPGDSIQLTPSTETDADGNEVTKHQAVFGVQLDSPASSVIVTIKDAAGKVVRTMDLGTQAAGTLPIIWDGTMDDGDATAADGKYSFTVSASNNGVPVNASALSFGTVSSVTMGADGATLNVSNIGQIKASDIVQIL